MSAFTLNEHGLWCPSCGEFIAAVDELDDDFTEPEECRCCGYPDAGAVASYHLDDDDDCWQCGGEGVTYDCFEEFACINPESGCDECERRCDVCNGKGRL